MAGESLGYVAVEVRADTTAARAELAKLKADIAGMSAAAAGGVGAMGSAAAASRTGIGAWAAAASTKMLSLSSSLNRVGKSMGTTGRMMTWRLSMPLAAIGTAAVKAANTFEMTFAKIEGLAGDIGVSMDEAKSRVKELAVAFGRDPQELAEGLYFIASAGVEAQFAMDVLEESARGAAAQLADTQTLAQMLTTVMNNYGKSGLTAAGALEVLGQAVKLGKAEPQEFADSLGAVIPMASQLGVTFASMAGAIAQGTNAGLSAARAATGLRFILGSLQRPSDEAKKVLGSYGLTVEELQAQFKNLGATGGIQYLAKLFDTTTTKGKEAFAVLMGGQRGLIIANALIGENLDNAKRIDSVMKGAIGSGVIDDALAKTQATQAQRFREMMAQLKVFAIDLGEQIVPILVKDVLPAIKSILDAFNDLSDVWKRRIVVGGIFAMLMGPALSLLGVVTRIIAGMVWIAGKGLGILAGRGAMAAAAAASGGTGVAAGAAGGAAATATAAVSAGLSAVIVTAVVAGIATAFAKWKLDNAAEGDVKDPRGTGETGLANPGSNKPDKPVVAGENFSWGTGGTPELGLINWLTGGRGEIARERDKMVRNQTIANKETERWTKQIVKAYRMSDDEAQAITDVIGVIDYWGGSLDQSRRDSIEAALKAGDAGGALLQLKYVVDQLTASIKNLTFGGIAHLQAIGKAAPSGTGGFRINPGGLAEHGAITGLAAGGFLVTRPTFIRGNVLTGEKRKKEAVIPLEDVRGKRILAGAMAEAMGSASGSTVVVNVAGKVERPEDIRRELDWWMRSRGL